MHRSKKQISMAFKVLLNLFPKSRKLHKFQVYFGSSRHLFVNNLLMFVINTWLAMQLEHIILVDYVRGKCKTFSWSVGHLLCNAADDCNSVSLSPCLLRYAISVRMRHTNAFLALGCKTSKIPQIYSLGSI